MHDALIKRAYAYGAGYAFRNAGYPQEAIEDRTLELAEDPDLIDRIGLAVTGSPSFAGLIVPEDKELKTFGHTYGKGLLGEIAGGAAGGAGGIGLGALLSRMRGKSPIIGGTLGGLAGGFLGSVLGKQIGLQKGFTSGYAD